MTIELESRLKEVLSGYLGSKNTAATIVSLGASLERIAREYEPGSVACVRSDGTNSAEVWVGDPESPEKPLWAADQLVERGLISPRKKDTKLPSVARKREPAPAVTSAHLSAMRDAAAIRELLPYGYEILPIEVIEQLIAAGYAAYAPALGRNDGVMASVHNAARAADNVLARYRERRRRPGSQESLE